MILMVALLVVSVVCIFIDFFLYGNAQQAHAQPAPNAQQAPVVGSAPHARSPHFISVRMKKPLETLIAGETGSFELEARLQATAGYPEKPAKWNR